MVAVVGAFAELAAFCDLEDRRTFGVRADASIDADLNVATHLAAQIQAVGKGRAEGGGVASVGLRAARPGRSAVHAGGANRVVDNAARAVVA
jgi:hypothetical protein